MVPVGMPRIPQNALDLVFYLYDSRQDAEKGAFKGATGFFVGYPSERFPKYLTHVYAVTNWHTACRGSSIIRINTLTGNQDIFEHDPSEWVFDPRYDIAAITFRYRPGFHKMAYVLINGFINQESINNGYGCVGEDVFMVGRFIDHDGGQTNKPAVRFGHVSTDPVPIKQDNGQYADCYCIDLHSRSGYSGSPVFAYRTPGANLEDAPHKGDFANAKVLLAGTNFMALLGIHWGQFPEIWELADLNSISEKAEANSLITDGKYVKGLSGMTCVLPASAILEVLNSPKLKAIRNNDDDKAAEYFRENGFPAEGEPGFAAFE